jgi:hypothetical protein
MTGRRTFWMHTDYKPAVRQTNVKRPFEARSALMMFKHSARTLQGTQPITISKTRELMSFREIITQYSDNHKKSTNTCCGQNAVLIVYLFVLSEFI